MKKQREGLPQGVRFNVLRRDHFTCRYCGRSSPEVVLHVDHIKPRSKGGEDVEPNLITACFDCNSGKRAKEVTNITPAHSLVGLFGLQLELDAETPAYQFKIIRQVDRETYLVQLFDWVWGDPSTIEARPVSLLLDPEQCRLHATIEQWHNDTNRISEKIAAEWRQSDVPAV